MPEGIREQGHRQDHAAWAPMPNADCLSVGTCRNIVTYLLMGDHVQAPAIRRGVCRGAVRSGERLV